MAVHVGGRGPGHLARVIGGWTPAALGSSLLGWWDAERTDKLTLSGSAVTTWTDVVGSYAATQGVTAAKPRWDANAFGGVLNKCTNYNNSPQALVTPTTAANFNAAISGVTASGDAATLFGVVDDSIALAAAGINTGNGRVYVIDNTAGAATSQIRIAGNPGNTNAHCYIAWGRASAGTGDVSRTSTGVSAASISGTSYARAVAANLTPGSTADEMRVRAAPGAVVYFTLNGLYEGSTAPTQDVVVNGSAAYGFGRPGLIFDGSDDELTLASVPFPTGASACEIWALVDQQALVADTSTRLAASYGGTGTANRRRIGRAVSGGANRGQIGAGDGASEVTATNGSVDFSGRHVARGIFRATEIQADMDGISAAAQAVVPATTSDRTRIGANSSPTAGGFWHGMMSTVIVTGALSTDQASQLTAYLKARGGIA